MDTVLQGRVDRLISGYPVFEYALLGRAELVFSDKVRYICTHECPHFGKSWACPPAIPELEDCMAACGDYAHALIFSTVSEVADSADFTTHLAARREHEAVTRALAGDFRAEFGPVLTLSTGCTLCDECTYPAAPCRYPNERTHSVESHGVLVLQTAAEQGLNYDCGSNVVTYFSLILFNGPGAP